MNVIRTETTAQRAGAHYVRIQGMAVKHHIPLEVEFDEHDTPETKYIVITDDVLPVATCRLFPAKEMPENDGLLDDHTMMLGRIVVLPEYRGRGLGRQVVTEAENWAKDLGYTKTALESRVGKVGFYEKLGYDQESGKVVQRAPFQCILMEKKLALTKGIEKL